jgi:N-acetylneuraminic acid mutarotase
MIISNDDYFEKFCSCKKIISSQYENIKYYIVLNGHETLKFGKYFNDYELLIKSEIKENQSFYSLFFDNCIENEYHFNLNIINEDQLTNIWGLL